MHPHRTVLMRLKTPKELSVSLANRVVMSATWMTLKFAINAPDQSTLTRESALMNVLPAGTLIGQIRMVALADHGAWETLERSLILS